MDQVVTIQVLRVTKDSKETVKIKNNFEASGKERDGSDAKKVSNTVEVPKNPKMQ